MVCKAFKDNTQFNKQEMGRNTSLWNPYEYNRAKSRTVPKNDRIIRNELLSPYRTFHQ